MAAGLEKATSSMDVAQLVKQYHTDVYRYAYRLSGRVEDAEDVAQQVFLIAQQKVSQLRETDKVRSWLLTITRRCFLRSVRKRKPIPASAVDYDLDFVPEVSAEDKIDRELLQQSLNELPEEYRVVVLMHYFEYLPYRDIADQLQLPIGTVMSRLSRAKSRLRQRLAPRLSPVSVEPGYDLDGRLS